MKIRNEKSIAIVYDAVSISKGLDVVSGSVKQNYYAESATYVPDRFIFPLVLQPRIEVSDPNKVIPNGDKVSELARLEWFVDGVKIKSNNDYAIEGTTLKVFRNSEEPFVISYRAEWLDPRKNQVIVIEDSLAVSCISLAQNDADATMSLSNPQNWIHNPLKGERVYTINAYVSKGKVYESAVEWYYVNKEGKDVLIDESCSFYVDGQYTNALDVDSSYMNNVVLKAKNISDDKLKEVYWFFDKHGKPISYASPEKTELKGANIFSLPSSPTAAKLDYRIEGLTIEQLVKNGDFRDKTWHWKFGNAITDITISNGSLHFTGGGTLGSTLGNQISNTNYIGSNTSEDMYYSAARIDSISDNGKFYIGNGYVSDNDGFDVVGIASSLSKKHPSESHAPMFSMGASMGCQVVVSNCVFINITQAFGKGNEPTKEWCDEHITGYFEGIKSVTTPLRVKAVGENLFNSKKYSFEVGYYSDNEGKPVGNISFCRTEKIDVRGVKGTIYINSNIPPQQQYTVWTYIKRKPYKRHSINNNNYFTLEGIEDEIGVSFNTTIDNLKYLNISYTDSKDNIPYKESNLYLNNNQELRSVGKVKDYIENGTLYKNISDDGEVLSQPEIINLNTSGTLTSYPNGTIFIEPATLVEQQYSNGITVNLPIKEIESIKVGTKSLDISKAVVKDNLITHPDLSNGDFVTLEYIYDHNPIYGDNSISYLSLEEILDDLWLDNVYTYKLTEGKWELVKVTEISDYEEWLNTEKTSPYILAPDGVVFGKYEAETKFIRQYPSSLYVDFIAPTRLKEGVSQIKARALVGTRDGVLENPSKYFNIQWYKRSIGAGQVDEVIGHGNEITIDVREKDMIGIEIESIKIKENGKKNQ